jgi:hypothetical protein
MGRKRSRIVGWSYDETCQELSHLNGRVITLHEILTMLADHRDCRIDFVGHWNGWRMRGDRLGSNAVAADSIQSPGRGS